MMADLQNNELIRDESATQESREKPDKGRGGRKKKKKRGCGFFILALLLVAGVAAGIQASGGADFRPVVYEVVPRLPVVGPRAAELIGIPHVYSLSTEERRKIELDEWELAIADAVRSLDVQQRDIARVSRDLSAKERELDDAQAELAGRLEALSNDISADQGGALNAGQRTELEQAIRTFQEMSPKNAAAIIERLNPELAVAVMDGLPEDFRARILGRMEASVAARLTERLTEYNRNR